MRSGNMSPFGMFRHFFSDTAETANIRIQDTPCMKLQQSIEKTMEILYHGAAKEPVKRELYKELFLSPVVANTLVVLQFIFICVLIRHWFVKVIIRILSSMFGHVKFIKDAVDDIRQLRTETLLAITKIKELEDNFNRYSNEMCDNVRVLFEYSKHRDMKERAQLLHKIALTSTARSSEIPPVKQATSDSQISRSSDSSMTVPPDSILRPSVSALAATPCRIPIFEDSPKPINPRKIRRYNGSAISTIPLAGAQRYNDANRRGRPTRIPLFENSPKPINVARSDV